MKLRGIDLFRDVDLAAIAYLALSARPREDASRTGPEPSADDSDPAGDGRASPDGAASDPGGEQPG